MVKGAKAKTSEPIWGNYEVSSGYYFASGRLRLGTALGQATAGKEHTAHSIEFKSPDEWTNKFRCVYQSHYTSESATPSELVVPNSFTLDGHSLQAFVNGQWFTQIGSFRGNLAITVDPTVNPVGVIGDDITFPFPIPPNTRMRVWSCGTAGTNEFLPVSVRNRSGTFEGASGSATVVQTAQLTNTSTPGGSDGRLGGKLFGPAFIVAQRPNGLTRPVVLVLGDSIAYGKNSNENVLIGSDHGGLGFISLALEDTTGLRMAHANFGCPSVGVGEWQDRSTWSRKLDLLRLVPNRPYTHIITEHYNNGPAGDYTSVFKPAFLKYYLLLKSESMYWGGSPASIFQTRPIPRPGSTDWCTTLENQGTDASGVYPTGLRWQFDADLLAGTYGNLAGILDTNTLYAYDQGDNRDAVSRPAYSSTLAGDFTSGGSVISTTASPAVGDFLVISPGVSQVGRNVTGVSGSGPYSVTLDTSVSSDFSAGTVVKASFVGDSEGLHPSTSGHIVISQTLITQKTKIRL